MLEKLASKGFIVFGLYHNDLNGKYPGPLSFRLMEIAATVHQLVAMNSAASDFFSNRLDFTHGVGLHGHSLGKSYRPHFDTSDTCHRRCNILLREHGL